MVIFNPQSLFQQVSDISDRLVVVIRQTIAVHLTEGRLHKTHGHQSLGQRAVNTVAQLTVIAAQVAQVHISVAAGLIVVDLEDLIQRFTGQRRVPEVSAAGKIGGFAGCFNIQPLTCAPGCISGLTDGVCGIVVAGVARSGAFTAAEHTKRSVVIIRCALGILKQQTVVRIVIDLDRQADGIVQIVIVCGNAGIIVQQAAFGLTVVVGAIFAVRGSAKIPCAGNITAVISNGDSGWHNRPNYHILFIRRSIAAAAIQIKRGRLVDNPIVHIVSGSVGTDLWDQCPLAGIGIVKVLLHICTATCA